MGILDTLQDYKDYKKWQNDKYLRHRFHQELTQSKLSEDQLLQAQALQRVVYDSFEKMDDMSQIYEQKISAYLQAIFIFVSIGLGAFLTKNAARAMKFISTLQYKNIGARFTKLAETKPGMLQGISTLLGLVPALIQLPVFFWAGKEASRLARHMARKEMDVKDFALYTPEQMKEAQEKSQYHSFKIKYVSSQPHIKKHDATNTTIQVNDLLLNSQKN